MRIVLFVGRLAVGGGEKVLTMIANHLAAHGSEVDIVTLLGSEVDREHFHLNEHIDIIDLHPIRNKAYYLNALYWLKKIRGVVKSRRPDIVISFFGRINALVLTATIGMHVPIIVSERNDPKRDGRGKMMLKYCDLIYRRASAIVFQTRYEQSCFSCAHSSCRYIIPNPIEIIDIPKIPVDENLIVSVGRLEHQKNHIMLVKAVEVIKTKIPNVRCEIYGEGSLCGELQKQIDEGGMENTIVLKGKKDNILGHMAKGKVLVMTSDYEGLSNALMEAMMIGKVCVSTNYDGVEDLIKNGENGMIVPRNDAFRLAEVLTDILLEKSEKYDELGKNARNSILAYSSQNIMSQWIGLINSLI